jgi:polysaccharide biosynthesis/export protein
MRVTRLLLMMVAVAAALAGCAQGPGQGSRGLFAGGTVPPPRTRVAAAVPAAPPAPGIDNVIYGSTAAPAAPPKPLYMSTAPVMVAAPAPRGLMNVVPPPRGIATGAPLVAPAVPVAVVAPVTPVAYVPTAEGPYTLDSGDRLRIVVFGQDGLSNSYSVDASGHIDMPLIGSVSARGVTTNELASRIAEKLRQGYVREPHVAVEIEAYRPFFILGEVTQPGQYPFVANMSVETAVAIAGGFTPRAFRKNVTVTRLVDGRQTRFTVPTTFPLRPGDTVNVQERWF